MSLFYFEFGDSVSPAFWKINLKEPLNFEMFAVVFLL
jgi:hypothetical protein